MNTDEYHVFGDSHSRCFRKLFKNVRAVSAASAKGLSNEQSTSQLGNKIRTWLKLLEPNSKLIFLFGKVDMDFVLNYKFNIEPELDFKKYITHLVELYTNFIAQNSSNKTVYICELPIRHLTDENMLKVIRSDGHNRNINKHNDKNGSTDKVSNFNKVIPYSEHLEYYTLFNTILKERCDLLNFKFLEINKYFKDDTGNFKIPNEYKSRKLDHHLCNIGSLYMQSLTQFT